MTRGKPVHPVFRIALILVQVVAFFVVAALSAKGYSYLSAKTYLPGDVPSSQFPVIAVLPRAPGPAVQYQLLRWPEIGETRRREPQITFRLPELEGRFDLPQQGEYVPWVRFKVSEAKSDHQLVEVDWHDDDYEFNGKYTVDGTTLRPVYFRVWGAATVFFGIIPGLICAWFVGWIVRRIWLKTPAPTPEAIHAPVQSGRGSSAARPIPYNVAIAIYALLVLSGVQLFATEVFLNESPNAPSSGDAAAWGLFYIGVPILIIWMLIQSRRAARFMPGHFGPVLAVHIALGWFLFGWEMAVFLAFPALLVSYATQKTKT